MRAFSNTTQHFESISRSEMRKTSKAPKPPLIGHANHARWFITGIVVSSAWTGLGCMIAAIQGYGVRSFIQDWISYQGPFLVWLGTWLVLMIRSQNLAARISAITFDGSVKPGIVGKPLFRLLAVVLVTALTFASGMRMGFRGQGAVLVFFWLTYLCIEIATGFITLHAIEIFAVVHNLRRQRIKLSHYAPARTPKLRSIVNYFSAYVLLIAAGQFLGLLGTIKGHWTGSRPSVQVFQWFWSLVYFPMSSLLLFYSHWMIHKLIKKEKEQTLSVYEQELEERLSKPNNNAKISQIVRTNQLAQLVDRITASPDYVIDFGIAVRTLLPLALNLVTVFVKPSVL